MSLNMQPTMKSMLMTPDFEKRLGKVNGVVIASKIPQGGKVFKKKSQFDRPGRSTNGKRNPRLACIICESLCWDLRGLRDHFVPCVERNGNPNGVRWNDALEYPGAPAGLVSTQSSGSQKTQWEGLQPENYQLNNAALDSSGQETFPDSFNDRHPQPVFAPADGLQRHNDDLQHISPQLTGLNPSSVHPYDPHLEHLNPELKCSYLNTSDPRIRVDVLTNKTLLSMLQAWQDVIYDRGLQYALEHPRFQELMKELVERELISKDWKWTVDVEEVDMAFARVVIEGL